MDAVALFVQRAHAADPGFALTEANAAAVAEVCARLDGLPLALELAAARLRAFSVEALLAQLTQRLRVLTGGERDRPDRQRTLRDALAWSHGLLPPAEQVLFRRLAVFVGGFGLEAAEAVAGVDADSGIDALEGVASLVDQSLLRREGPSGESRGAARFRMLETVREYGLERLAASGAEATARDRHAAWCLALAEAAEPDLSTGMTGRNEARWYTRLDAELANLRAALAWFDETGEHAKLLRLLSAIESYWISRPFQAEVYRWLERALGAAPDAPAAERAAAHDLAIHMAGILGNGQTAIAHAEEELALARQLGDPFVLGRAHFGAGAAWSYAGDAARASAACAEAVPLFREAGATGWLALALAEIGDARLLVGDVAGAVPPLDEALALRRRLEHSFGTAVALGGRGHAALAQGDEALAARLFAESLALAREIGYTRMALGAAAGLAGVALARGNPERAARLLGAVDTAQEASGAGRMIQALHAQRIATRVRKRLGEHAFLTAWDAGRVQSIDEALGEAAPSDARGDGDSFGLSPREREVLALLAQRLTDPEIAARLFISPHTASTHVKRVLGKLGAANRREAAALAARHGLL